MRILIAILINGLVVYFTSWLFEAVHTENYVIAVIVGLLLALVNATIRPVLTFLTLPITILTLGLFLLIINGAMVLFVDWLVPGFQVDGLLWAILFSLVLAFFNLIIGSPLKSFSRKRRG